jgi:hypothetical protein
MTPQIINETKNGLLFFCTGCKRIHLEYKNINLNFTKSQLHEFHENIHQLDGPSWEHVNQNSPFKRKIVLPLDTSTFNFLVNMAELIELKQLIHPPRNSSLERILKNINTISRCN